MLRRIAIGVFVLAAIAAPPALAQDTTQTSARPQVLPEAAPPTPSGALDSSLTLQPLELLITNTDSAWLPRASVRPGHFAGIRLTLPSSERSAARAHSRLTNIVVVLHQYGNHLAAQYHDSLFLPLAFRDVDTVGGRPYVGTLALGRLPASDSILVEVREPGRRYVAYPLWRQVGTLLPSLRLFGNLHSPSDSLASELEAAPLNFMERHKGPQSDYVLYPIVPGALPPNRPMLLELEYSSTASLSPWIDAIRVTLLRYHGTDPVDTVAIPGPAFTETNCGIPSGAMTQDSLCVSVAYLGRVPFGDSVDAVVSLRSESSRVRVWRTKSSQFLIALALGTSFPLNKLSSADTAGGRLAPRVGFNGRVVLTEWNPEWIWNRWHLFNTSVFTGPIILEGELLLGLSTLQTSSADTNRYEQSTEGSLRLSVPLMDFGRDVTLRGLAEIGSVSIRNIADLHQERYAGARVGLDAYDISGRQSYVEFAWGTSDNLTPHRRRRVTVQFRVPTTRVVVQFRNSFGRGDRKGVGFQNTSILSVFVPLDPKTLLGIFGIAGQE